MKRGTGTKQAEPAIPAIPIDKEAQLVKELGAIITVLDNMENDWEKRANAMRRLQGIAKGGSPRAFPTVFSEQFVKRLKEPLCKQFGDLRSSLVKEAATCIETLSAELGELLEPIIDPLVETIMTMLGTTNKVLQTELNRAMVCILAAYKVNRSIAKICYFALTTKVSTQRQYSIDYIGRIIRSHKRYAAGFFDRNLDEIEKILKKALTDGIPSIRDLARSVFWDFYAAWERRGLKVLDSLDPNTKKNLLKDDPRPQKGSLARTAQDDLALQKQRRAVAGAAAAGAQKGKLGATDPALRLNTQIGDDDDIDDLFFSTNPDIVGKRREHHQSKQQQQQSPLSSPQKQRPKQSSLYSPQKQKQPTLSSPQKQKQSIITSPQKAKQSTLYSPQKVKGRQDNNGVKPITYDDDEMLFERPLDFGSEGSKKKDLGRLSGLTASFSAVSFRRGTGYSMGTPDQAQSPPLQSQAAAQGEGALTPQEQSERETAERINAFRKLNECLKTQPEYELTKQLKDILDLIKSSLCDEDTNNDNNINNVNNNDSSTEAIGRETLELVLTLIRKYHGYVVYNLDAILSPVFSFAVRHPLCGDLCGAVMDATLASFSQDIVVPLAFRMLRSTVGEGNYGGCLPLLTFILKGITAFPGYFHSVAKIKTYLPTLTTVAMAANCAAAATEILTRIFEGSRKDFVIAFLSFSPREYKDMRDSLPLIIPGLTEELASYGTEREAEAEADFMGFAAFSPAKAADAQKARGKPVDAVDVVKVADEVVMAGIEDVEEIEPIVVVKKQDAIVDEDLDGHMVVEQQEIIQKQKKRDENEMSTEEEEKEKEEKKDDEMMMVIEENEENEEEKQSQNDLVLPLSPPQVQQEQKESDEQQDKDKTILYDDDEDDEEEGGGEDKNKGDENANINDIGSEISNTHSYSGDSAAVTEKHSETEDEHNTAIDGDFDITSNPSIVEGITGTGTGNGGSSDVDSLLIDMEEEEDNDNDNNSLKPQQPSQPQLQLQLQQQPQQPQLSTPQKSFADKPTEITADHYQVPISEDVSLYLEDTDQPPRIKGIIGRILCSKTSQEYSSTLSDLLQAVRDDRTTLTEQSTGAAISAVCSRLCEMPSDSAKSPNFSSSPNSFSAEMRDAGLKALCELLGVVPELVPVDAMRQTFVAATLIMDEYSAQITQGTIPMLRLSANVLVRMKSANQERYFRMLVDLCSSEAAPRVLEAAIHNLAAFCASVDKAFLASQQGIILNSLIKPVNSPVAGVRKESTLCLAECCALLPDNQFFIEKLQSKLTPIQMRLVTYYYNEKTKY